MMQEQRLIVRLGSYWEMLRKDNIMPAIEQFNPHMVADLWPKCARISLDHRNPNATSYLYEYVGQDTISMLGADLTGHTVDMRLREDNGLKILKYITTVSQTQKMQVDEDQFVNKRGQLVKYRCCFLPFGDAKRGITHIIIGISYRSF
jgi:hypothetical protein